MDCDRWWWWLSNRLCIGKKNCRNQVKTSKSGADIDLNSKHFLIQTKVSYYTREDSNGRQIFKVTRRWNITDRLGVFRDITDEVLNKCMPEMEFKTNGIYSKKL